MNRSNNNSLKLIVIYGVFMATAAFVLQWLEVRYFLQMHSTNVYVVVLCGLFAGLGVWVGHKLTKRNPDRASMINTQALRTLGISPREQDVLQLLAAGHSNQEIADRLFIANSTVKTHLHHLYRRLNVSRRGQAVEKARSLQLIL